MTAKLKQEKPPAFGGKANAGLSKVNGAAPRIIIPGVDDQ